MQIKGCFIPKSKYKEHNGIKMYKQKAPWKLEAKQIPLYYLVTLAKSFCFSRSYSLSPFLNNLKFLLVSAKINTIKVCYLQNQLSILISIISSIFVIARPVYSNKWKLKWYKKWTNKKLHENWDQNKYLSIIWSHYPWGFFWKSTKRLLEWKHCSGVAT